MKTTQTTRLQFAATIFGALAVLVLAPATANAQPVGSAGAEGGCTYTDADGYDIPIDNGQGVFVDGKIVSCRDGQIVITTAPKRNVGNVRPHILDPQKAPVTKAPKAPQLVASTLPTSRVE